MSHGMIQYLVLNKGHPSRNVARYYVLPIEPSLLGDVTRVCECSWISRPGYRQVELCENGARCAEALDTWLRRKQLRRKGLRQEEQG